jgi:hypothetical protein
MTRTTKYIGSLAAIVTILTWIGIRPKDIMSDTFIIKLHSIVNEYWYVYLICGMYFVIQTIFLIIGSITGWRDYAKLKNQILERHDAMEKEHTKAMLSVANQLDSVKGSAMILYRWHKSGKPWPTDLEKEWDKLYRM